MKQTLLLMTAALAVSASAQVMEQQHLQVQPSQVLNTRFMKAAPERGTVVKVLHEGRMGKLQIVRTADGRLAKQIVRNGVAGPMSVIRPLTATAALGSLNEDFGSWDGETADWLPEGWSEINSDNPGVLDYAASYTWHVDNNAIGFLASPTRGYNCAIYMASDQDTYMAIAQDEWLVTPAVTIEAGQQLQVSHSYSPIFMFDLNYVDWDTFEFTDAQCAASVKVMIREVGTEEWTLIEDYFDLWVDWSLNDLFDGGMDNAWRKYTYSLDDYAGKDVEVAFRYSGQNGDNWAIDCVSIDQPRPEACYTRPQGALYWGFSDTYTQLKGDGLPLMIVPGDVDLTWTNTSNSDATLFSWTYSDPVTDEVSTRSERDLTLCYPMKAGDLNWYDIPVLEAYASEGATPSVYTWNGYALQAGGTTQYEFSNGTIGIYGAGNYDADLGLTSITFSAETPVWGFSEGTDAGWTGLLGQTAELLEVGNYFDQPAAPYTLHGIQVFAGGTYSDDAQITANVYEVVNGYLGNIIASATCQASDIVVTNGSLLCLPFSFEDIEVENALLVMLDIKSSTGFTTLSPWHTYYADPQQETNGYFTLNVNGREELHGVNYIQSSDGPMYCSFYFNLMMEYPTADDPTAIRGIEQLSTVATQSFNVAGQRVDGQQNGLVIERMANGQVRKALK